MTKKDKITLDKLKIINSVPAGIMDWIETSLNDEAKDFEAGGSMTDAVKLIKNHHVYYFIYLRRLLRDGRSTKSMAEETRIVINQYNQFE